MIDNRQTSQKTQPIHITKEPNFEDKEYVSEPLSFLTSYCSNTVGGLPAFSRSSERLTTK